MRLIALTQGKFARVDDADFDWLNQWKWCAHKWARSGVWYAVRNLSISESRALGKKQIQMHQALLPEVVRVDHRDHDGLNNQRNNLRSATHSQNMANARKRMNNPSPFKGVRFRADRGYWQARLGEKHLGSFGTAKDAARAYNAAAEKQYGEFACLNPI